MVPANAELIDPDKGIFKVLDTVLLRINSPYSMQFSDIEEENARGGIFSFFDKLGEDYIEIASITIADVSADITEPDIASLRQECVAAFDAQYFKACSDGLPSQGRKLLKWMGSQLNESADRKALVTAYTVDEDGDEKQFIAIRISGNSKKLAAIGSFSVARANELAAPIFSILQNMQIIPKNDGAPLTIRQMIHRDFGVDIPLESGCGKRAEPFKLSNVDRDQYGFVQLQLIDCISLGRGIYWKTQSREIVEQDNKPLEKVSIETIELTETQRFTGSEAYYFKPEPGVAHELSSTVMMDTPRQGLILPFEIGWLHFRYFTNYEEKEPGLGFSASYSAPKIEATLYVYDNGLSKIPDDLEDPLVQEEFEKTNAVVAARLPEAEAWPDDTTDRKLMRIYRVDPEGFKVTCVALTTSNNHFIKVRISWDRDYDLDAISMTFIDIVLNTLRSTRH